MFLDLSSTSSEQETALRLLEMCVSAHVCMGMMLSGSVDCQEASSIISNQAIQLPVKACATEMYPDEFLTLIRL